MWHRVGEYGLEGVVWSMAQHEKSKKSLLGSIVQVQTFFFIFISLTCFDVHIFVWKFKILSFEIDHHVKMQNEN
jgi:hypothetical protein